MADHPADEATKHYSYTIITTDSNKQLSFLHDRMPVILDNGSEELRTWLDPGRHEWTKELQALLKPFGGELDVYPVRQDVGKVGNNSSTFIVPLDSQENKSNIANFFAKAATQQPKVKAEPSRGFVEDDASAPGHPKGAPGGGTLPTAAAKQPDGRKREAEEEDGELSSEKKKKKLVLSSTPPKGERPKISATSNRTRSPQKPQKPSTRKITQFFGNSS